MSIFLNIASVVLVLPVVATAVFFLVMDAIVGRPLGAVFMSILLWMPDPNSPVSAMLAICVLLFVIAGLSYLMIRVVYLFPLIVLLVGAASLVCVITEAHDPPGAGNLFLWAAGLGITVSAVQLKRSLFPWPPRARS